MFKFLKLYKGQFLSYEEFIDIVRDLGYRRVQSCGGEGDFSIKGETIDLWPQGFENPLRIRWEFQNISSIKTLLPRTGTSIFEHEVIFILPLFRKAQRVIYTQEVPLSGYLDLKKDDFVVHINYGIGIYRGRKKIKGKDYFVLEYENKDKVYVPSKDLHLIQKYISLIPRKPKLSSLGTKQWRAIKKRVRKGIHRFALELIRIEALRKGLGGFAYSPDTDWQKVFEQGFPYEETPHQKIAWEDVKNDMESPGCMERIICGDVGYGKTEVAMRAAFKAVMDSKQVCFLVPTTVLAQQHYYNFSQRTKDFPLRIEMLSRFRRPKEQEEIIKDIERGRIDIVVGTHSLLRKNINFKDLGLLIVDEEQRFGVKDKERIKKLKASVDVLTLTATPIPRTLYMALTGIKNISVIATPPLKRRAVKTFVCQFDKDLIKQAILREKRRGGQVYFIHNRIQDIEKVYRFIREILPEDFSIGLAYGRMSNRLLEKVVLEFIKGNVDILVSTNIIESGIDVPRANTIIIDRADLFGLADLHQLRGRVGRRDVQAYAYFLVPSLDSLSQEAKKRLEALVDASFLGAGFYIAMQDLEIRGAGNILGEEQHGFIYSIGFDLYCRLLKEEVEILKRQYSLV